MTCFFVRSKWRGGGVASAMLRQAIALAKHKGASAIEGYPVVPASGHKIPAAFAWTGIPTLFAQAGFKKLKRPAGLRPIYRMTF